MNAPERLFLPDTRSPPARRRPAIRKVGVQGASYPVALGASDGEVEMHFPRFIRKAAPVTSLCPRSMKFSDCGAHDRRSHITIRAEVSVGSVAPGPARDPRIGRFVVASENFESIHNHSAYAEIEGVGAGRDG